MRKKILKKRVRSFAKKSTIILLIFFFIFTSITPVFTSYTSARAISEIAPSDVTTIDSIENSAPTEAFFGSESANGLATSAPDSNVIDLASPENQPAKDKRKDNNLDKTKDTGKLPDDLEQAQSASASSDPASDNGASNYNNNSKAKINFPESDAISGALIYNYPIEVPPGRNGIQPSLNLTYNSQNTSNDNILGYGWNIGIAYIERINKKGTDKLYAKNYFNSSLSGELVNISGINYGAKVDNGEFLKYEFANNSWLVTDKQGVRYKFGASADARQDDSADMAKVFKWMLEEVRDLNDNYIRYEYFKDAGQIYPSRIIYTGNGATDGIFTAEFSRQSRSDTYTSYATGFQVMTNYRIIEIQTQISGNWTRKYSIAYVSGDNATRSILSSIAESGLDENGSITTFPATSFEYLESTSGWNSASTTWSFPFDLRDGVIVDDINGDGLSDLMQSYTNGVSTYKGAYINDGKGNFVRNDDYLPPVNFAYNEHGIIKDYDVRTADVNGDGLTDLVGYQGTFINNGNGWTASSSFGTLSFKDANGKEVAKMIDINGDGLSDFVRAWTDSSYLNVIYTYAYINDGNNFILDESWSLPRGFDRGDVIITDSNGDGLPDILRSFRNESGAITEYKEAYINNGKGGFISNESFIPPVVFYTALSGGTYRENGVRSMDVNGDGFADLVKDGSSGYTKVYMNNGNGWTELQIEVPDTFHDLLGSNSSGIRILDINGDGISDFAKTIRDNGIITHLYVNKTDIKPDIVSKATFSKGGLTDVSYLASSQYKDSSDNLLNSKMFFSLDTVSQITHDDGFGGSVSKSYSYEGGRYYFDSTNPFDKKFAGFAKVTETDAAGNVSKTYYHQGDESNSAQGEYQDNFYKIGKPYRTEIYDNEGNPYFKIISKWESDDLGGDRNFVKLIQKIEQTHDGDLIHKDKAEEYSYDNTNGNMVSKMQWGEVIVNDNGTYADVAGYDNILTTYSYASNSAANILDLPCAITVTDYISYKTKEDRFYYDNQSLGIAAKGNETKHEMLILGNDYISIQKTYDGVYGLVIKDTDARGNNTNYSYDPYHLYPATITDPLGHAAQYQYDYSSGQVKQKTDPNSRVFQYVYDGLDRLLIEKQPDLSAPSTLVDKTAYIYTDTSGAVSVKRTDYLSATASVNSITYFDGLGRKIQERKQAEGTNYEAKDYAYNDLGLLQKESLPYFSAGSARTSATATSALYASYSYDPMLRIIEMIGAAGTIKNYYDDWKTTVTDRNGKRKNLYEDAYGRLTGVDEYVSGSPYSTYYDYDILSNLAKITDAAGNFRYFTYNGLSQRWTAEDLHEPSDPSFGMWVYDYDGNGNMINKNDPNDQTFYYDYDDLNRILSEDYCGKAGMEAHYAYDEGVNGIGRLSSVSTDAYYQTNTYDPLGNLASETKVIGSAAYTTFYTYDRQGNLLSITNPDNSIIKYEHGTGGLLNKVSRKESSGTSYVYVVSNLDYSPMEQLTVISYANGMKTTNTYDSAKLYRLSSKVTIIAGGAKGQSISYVYDSNGNITKLTDASATITQKTVNYVYDDLNRLISASATGVAAGQSAYTENYAYGIIGNITSKTGEGNFSYDGSAEEGSFANPHAVTSIGSTNYTYDNNGNLLSDGNLTNTWDYDNRLTKSVIGSAIVNYAYDAGGQRLTVSDGNVTTTYATKFYNTDGASPTKHIFAGGIEIGTITGTGTGVVIHYTATDHLTGSNLTTNSSDAKEELLDYFPFGTIRLDQKSGNYSDQRKFAGQEFDADTGLSYMNARYYDSGTGRFISQDAAYLDLSQLQTQLIDPQSWNSYAYGRNNPLKYNDPDGQFWDTVIDVAFTGRDIFGYGKNMMVAAAGAANIGIGSLMNNQRIINAGDSQLSQGVQGMNNLRGDLALDAAGTALPFVPVAGLKAAGKADEAGRAINKTGNILTNSAKQTRTVKELDVNSRAIKNVRDIAGFTEHGIDQIITRGVKPGYIKDAVTNTTKIIERVDNLGRTSFRYIGEKAVVNFNKAGKIITGWIK